MKNKVFAFFTVLILCFSMIVPASAAGTHIFEDKGLITDTASLEAIAQSIEEKYGFSVLLSVIDGVGDEGTYAYCEALYNFNAAGQDGIALTYNYGDNLYSFYCAGIAEELFPEDVCTNTLWAAFARHESYNDCALAYYTAVEDVLKENNVTPVETTETEVTETETEQAAGNADNDITAPFVADNADVLTDDEETALAASLEAISEKYALQAAVLTVDSYGGKTDRAYADDCFIKMGYGFGENKDGLLFVFNTGNDDGVRNVYLATHGSAIEYITDFEIDVIFELVIPYLEKGEYAAAFDIFADEVDGAIDPSTPVFYIPFSIAIGFLIAFIIVKIQASKLKTVRPQVNAADYVGNVELTYRSDNFMYKDIRKVKKSSDSSSGSGGSTHKSSSGDTFGGKGRNF